VKNVIEIGKDRVYQASGDLVGELNKVIDDFSGKISLTEAIGALELVKFKLIERSSECQCE